MSVAGVGEEIGHAIIAHPRHQAVAGPEEEVERHSCRHALALKVDDAEHIVQAQLLAEARRHDQRPEGFENGTIEHRTHSLEQTHKLMMTLAAARRMGEFFMQPHNPDMPVALSRSSHERLDPTSIHSTSCGNCPRFCLTCCGIVLVAHCAST
jgi:hypothetical protein